jgi:predicted site-specific integrase-resolvase
MGYPNATSQIRNIPVGSERYYLCYPALSAAYGYQVKKNDAGEIVEIVNQSEDKTFEQELVDDVLSLITVFSAKLYGSRSRKGKKLVNETKKIINED